MPFPTTTALPLLSGDTRVRTHTGTRKYTLLRSKVISPPLLFPIRKNLLSGNILKRQTGSLGRACPLSPGLREPNQQGQEKCQGKKAERARPLTATQTAAQMTLASLP